MAVVYRARHTGTDRICALKFIRPALAGQPKTVELFLKEARIAGRIGSHPHIVDVLDSGLDEEREAPFIAMEMLSGDTLSERLEKQGPIDHPTVCSFFAQLGDALVVAHEAGVVHRDLKPDNIFLTEDRRGDTVLKVMDFGIAKILDVQSQGTATQVGTPVYCAPEQLGKSVRELAAEKGITVATGVSPATDVWALGLIALEMLTGVSPDVYWEINTFADLMVKVALEPRRPPSTRGDDGSGKLPEGFDGWFLRATAHNAAERFQSAGEAVVQLITLLGGVPEARRSLPSVDATIAAAATKAGIDKTIPTSPVVTGLPHDTHEPWLQTGAEAKRSSRWPKLAALALVAALGAAGLWVVTRSSDGDSQASAPSAEAPAATEAPTSSEPAAVSAETDPPEEAVPTASASATSAATASAAADTPTPPAARPPPVWPPPQPTPPPAKTTPPPPPEPVATAEPTTPPPKTDDELLDKQY